MQLFLKNEMEKKMDGSGILQQAIKIKKVNKVQATHFALCNGGQIRYLIAVDGGKRPLSRNISAYSAKLKLLMETLDYIPFSLMQAGKLGHFVNATLHPALEEQFEWTKAEAWNLIVGTYDEKQKLVMQCFYKNEKPAVYIKVGNQATESEMSAEINFLCSQHDYKNFRVPELLGSKFKNNECPFNIQMTKEFGGEKAMPALTSEIIRIYKELAGQTKIIDGVECEFSHGDFAPWNVKKEKKGYIVFDWEHCGMRMKGFDLMHYAVIIEVVINGKSFSDAFDDGLEKIRKLEPEFFIDKKKFLCEFEALRTQIG